MFGIRSGAGGGRFRRSARIMFTSGLLLLGAAASVVMAESSHTVELADGGRVHGVLYPTAPCAILLVADNLIMDLPLGKIVSVDGAANLPTSALEAPVLRNEVFDHVMPSGDVVHHSSFSKENAGKDTVRELNWGVGAHEVELLENWRIFDDFGNELLMNIKDRGDGGRRVNVDLVRPVLPGESVRFATRILFDDYVHADGETFTYRHMGNYPEKRLVSRMVRLPEGAEVIEVSPEPARQFDLDGAPVVVWQRLFEALEEFPLEVRYTY